MAALAMGTRRNSFESDFPRFLSNCISRWATSSLTLPSESSTSVGSCRPGSEPPRPPDRQRGAQRGLDLAGRVEGAGLRLGFVAMFSPFPQVPPPQV